MIVLKNIDVSYGSQQVIRDLSLDLPSKGMYLILGNNGTGKTTLLKAICGLQSVDSGLVQIKGKAVQQWTVMERSNLISYADTPFPLPAFMKLSEYVSLGRLQDESRLSQALEGMQIADLADRHVLNLSRGQQQKAMLAAMTYAANPVYLLDEPTNYLDYPSVENFWQHMEKQARERLIVATVHNPDEALKRKAEILVMKDHQLLNLGPQADRDTLISLL